MGYRQWCQKHMFAVALAAAYVGGAAEFQGDFSATEARRFQPLLRDACGHRVVGRRPLSQYTRGIRPVKSRSGAAHGFRRQLAELPAVPRREPAEIPDSISRENVSHSGIVGRAGPKYSTNKL